VTYVKDSKWDNGEPSGKLSIGEQDKQLMADYLQAGLKMGKPREVLLDELADKYKRSTRQIERYIARFLRPEADLRYEETHHKRKIRRLAKTLAREINIPTPWDKDLWRDLPVEFKEGEYSLSIGNVEIGHDRAIKVKYHDIGAGVAAPHLVKGLYSHLDTSGLSKFTEIVSDKGKLNSLVREIERYSQGLLAFLKVILDDVGEYRVKVNFRDEAKTGLTRWFIITAWHCVLWSALGNAQIDDSLYGPHESVPGTSLWQIRWGGSVIGIARDRKTLRTYESRHKKLRDTHTENPLTKEIAARYKRLSESAQDIRQRLEEFSDMQRLPGHCQLC
jgi:hypothetical protein